MLDFVFILLIFVEIILTCFAIKKALELEKKVNALNLKLIQTSELILVANKKIYSTLKKLNRIISFVTNKKFIQIKKIISLTISIVQIVILLKSFNFSKGFKFNYKNLKNLIFTQAFKSLFKKVISSIEACV